MRGPLSARPLHRPHRTRRAQTITRSFRRVERPLLSSVYERGSMEPRRTRFPADRPRSTYAIAMSRPLRRVALGKRIFPLRSDPLHLSSAFARRAKSGWRVKNLQEAEASPHRGGSCTMIMSGYPERHRPASQPASSRGFCDFSAVRLRADSGAIRGSGMPGRPCL